MIAPLAVLAAGAEAAFDDAAGLHEAVEDSFCRFEREAEAFSDLGSSKRAVGAAVATQEVECGVGDRDLERGG